MHILPIPLGLFQEVRAYRPICVAYHFSQVDGFVAYDPLSELLLEIELPIEVPGQLEPLLIQVDIIEPTIELVFSEGQFPRALLDNEDDFGWVRDELRNS